jgi:ergothioneine biosynthesis protein EgtB
MTETTSKHPDTNDLRTAGSGLLSLALIDARNHSLHLASLFEASPVAAETAGRVAVAALGRMGWFQEWWIGRHVQRHLGPYCEPDAVRLASIEPMADTWWKPSPIAAAGIAEPPRSERVRAYLLEILESSLDLLSRAAQTPEGLYVYRLSLFHELQCTEDLIVQAQTLGLPLPMPFAAPAPARSPIGVPAMRWSMGRSLQDGFAFDHECPVHEVELPEFEIDAQAVTWAQYVEFVDDSGYDREELWHPQGWQWLQQASAAGGQFQGRRGPRYVDQIGVASGAVMQTRFGKPMRMLGHHAATHVTWWEADAWARWAGRRLPAEAEWEAAAHTALRLGFRWGEVWEWTCSTFRPYPGFAPGPWADCSAPHFGSHKVLRGGSFATRTVLKNARFRNFARPEDDLRFCGFRTCAM